MQAHAKTRPTNPARHESPYRFSFKQNTPRSVLDDAKKRYAPYLSISPVDADDELIPIEETAWYKQTAKEMTPAVYLKTWREIKGYSQAKLGEVAGISGSRVSDYENGYREISKAMAKKFARIFHTSPANFI